MDDLTIKARLLNGVSRPAADAQRSVQNLAKATADLARASAQQQAILGRTHLDTFKSNLNGIHGTLGRLKGGFHSVANGIDRLGMSALRAGGHLMRSLGQGLKRAGLGLAGLAVYAGKAYGELEQTEVAFKTILGSTQLASSMMTDMERFAKTTPFRFQQVTDAAKMLLAGGWQQNTIIPTLTKLGDAASAVGVPLDRVLSQITQMRAKNALSFGDMRILGDAGLPAFDILANKIKTTTKDLLSTLSSPGGGRDLFQKGGLEMLIDGLGERYKGMMDNQAKTFMGRLSNLFDAFSMGAARAAKPFVDGFVKPFVTKITPTVEKILGKLGRAGKLFGEGFQVGGLRGGLVGLDQFFGKGPRLAEMFDKWKPRILEFFAAIRGGFTWLVNNLGVVKNLVLGLAAAFVAVTVAQAAAFVASPIGIFAGLVAGLVVGFVWLWRHSERFQNAVKAIGRFGVQAFKWIVDHAKQAGRAISSAWRNVKGFFGALGRAPKNIGSAIAHGWHAAGGAIRKAWNATRGFREAVGRLPKNAINGIKSAFSL